jgi:hypothetical protein
MRPACCRHVREHFSYERQSQACLALYRDLLRNEQCLQRKRPRTSKTVGTGEAAPELQRIFPQLLQYVFETGRVEVPSSSASPTDKKEQFRRAQFVRRVRRILESAAEGSLRIANLRASLDAELAILGGKSAWRVQAKLFFNRILRIP